MTQEESNSLYSISISLLKKEGYHPSVIMHNNNCHGLRIYDASLSARDHENEIRAILHESNLQNSFNVSYNSNTKNISVEVKGEKGVKTMDMMYMGGDNE